MKIDAEMQERMISEELSSRFKQYRIKKSVTMAELSAKSGVSVGTIVRFENGNDIGLLNLIKLMKALGLEDNIEQLIPELPYEEPPRAGVIPMPRVNRIKRKKNINQY